MTSTADSAVQGSVPTGYEAVPFTAIPLRPRRRAIARNMELASAVPSLTADMQMDLSQLLAARASWNGAEGRRDEDRLSVMAFVAKAAVSTLTEFPSMNATFTDRAILQWTPIHLGIAVDAPGGLVVPVIRDAQDLGVDGIGRQVRELAERARIGKLGIDDLTGGTFTLSNPGAVGPCLRAEALLNPPQVALLGLPGLRRVPIVVGSGADESVEIRPVLCPSLTFDHRALDGGEVVRYLAALTDRVHHWSLEDYLQANTTAA
jgi:pyruvate/2-oxoglutarate dehydrogenase complex dihydrolipoamide acyltransferase (E2) component